MRVTYALIIALALFACKQHADKSKATKTYLALGDSYTIGESVTEAMRWPNLLQDLLVEDGEEFAEAQIIAKTGWRSDDLIHAIEAADLKSQYDLVSILIGVNNQYQGKDTSQYSEEFKYLLEKSISLCKTGSNGVFVVSIPDYGLSPFARDLDSKKIGKEIDQYNKIAREICNEYKVEFINITEISRLAISDLELIAEDNLHPSAKMYQMWMKEIHPIALNLLH